jgi:hypothetical protein
VLQAYVLADMKYDLIIGNKDIKQNNLVLDFPQDFLNMDKMPRLWDFTTGRRGGRISSAELEGTDESDYLHVTNRTMVKGNPNSDDSARKGKVARCSSPATVSLDNRNATTGKINSLNDFAMEPLSALSNTLNDAIVPDFEIRSEYDREDMSEVRDNQMEAIPSEMLDKNINDDDNLPKVIEGPPSLQLKLKNLILKFRFIFSRKVKSTPANLPPFTFTVDEEKWRVPKNKLHPRRYDKTKSLALRELTEQLLALGVIKPSKAAYYSHGFPVPKSSKGLWRIVVDLKNLNQVSTTERWPIPNIKQMLQRLGTHRATYFAVMDLTSGYHQAPIHPTCQEFTAFMTDMGLYEWTRLAMGLQGAGPYFQRVLSTEVLPGLIHLICELYMDDCIVPGEDEDSFIERLEQVFQRFADKNITLHPDKCRFGLSEVEYVGHTINKHGCHFTRSRIDSIMDFKDPSTQKELKSFLGFANWFRDHVRDFANIAHPLTNMLRNYNKRRKLQWTAEGLDSFIKLKTAIHECPQLFFLDDESPIFLHTDASDYGIGAYLFQLMDGTTEKPIAFLSKSLDDRMKRWDTPQKEGYAIFYALDKFDYLLRDRKFTIKTDHANLTRLRVDYSANKKVQRWLLCFQHYNATFEYIKGKDNVVADVMSRHCVNHMELHSIEGRLNLQELRIPEKYESWIRESHNSSVGHNGIDNTIEKLNSSRPTWPDRLKHVRMFIARCPCCQKMNQRHAIVHAYPTTASAYNPMQRIAIDYIERLIPDEQGNTAICVIIDCFSRFIELYPVKAISSEVSAECLLDHVGRYGVPEEITHDGGSSFVNEIVQQLIKQVGSSSKIATAYSKEENPIVERANKEVMRHLRNIIFDEGVLGLWSKVLPLVQRIMNSSVHAATGYTPAQLIFNNAIDLDKGFLFANIARGNRNQSYAQWIEDMITIQSKIIDIARQNLTEKDEIHMKTYPKDRTDFEIGSYVLVEHRHNSLRRGPRSKLLPFLKGPMRVLAKKDNKYTLQDIVNLHEYDYHIKKLRVFDFDPTTQNPLTYALKDDGNMYQVERISKHKGDPTKLKTQLFFLVHWVGYETPTWEPWSQVRRLSKLHEYISNHKNKKVQDLLPKNFIPREHVFSEESDDDEL